MGRSVDYLNYAEYVGYINFSYQYEGDTDYDRCYEWNDFLDWLQMRFEEKYRSLSIADFWDNDEVHIILENSLAKVAVAEYCGLVSVSIAPIEDCEGRTALGENWIRQISNGVNKILEQCPWGDRLSKIGTASNGVSFFEKVI